jgi:transposase
MPRQHTAGKLTTRRYSMEENQAAVRMVRSLQAETGMTHGAVRRVAEQLGYGVESVRSWVKQADVDDGVRPGVSTSEAERPAYSSKASAALGCGGLSAVALRPARDDGETALGS